MTKKISGKLNRVLVYHSSPIGERLILKHLCQQTLIDKYLLTLIFIYELQEKLN